jgi:hypothetical protein
MTRAITVVQQAADALSNRLRVAILTRQIARAEAYAHPQKDNQAPIVFFNASTRLYGLSLNAAFASLTAWGLRLVATPVVHFVCWAGMTHCVLGTNRENLTAPPPCAGCMAQSRRLYAGAQVRGWNFKEDPGLKDALQSLNVAELSVFEYPFAPVGQVSIPGGQIKIPLGRLALPSIRWALRLYTLSDDQPTRGLLRSYIQSAYCLAGEFTKLLTEIRPATVLIFNGALYPEATARWVADQMGIRTVAHEVGFQRYSTFFTEGEPTAYPIHIPDEFELNEAQNRQLDTYLEQRFQGKFSMAGIQFWPEMRGLDESFLKRAAEFKQIVPVFTNVVYDTSQVHANVVFSHMFAWLDLIARLIHSHPQTLFVIRAHPDEMRPGKISQESVQAWVERTGLKEHPNVVFIPSREFVSSYELIQRSKFVMVYNSSIGLEATLLGKAVLCGGKARYTQYPGCKEHSTVFFPQSVEKFEQQAEEFLDENCQSTLHAPAEFLRNARRFLYYQLYRTSLPMDEFIREGRRPGFVQLRRFSWQQLLPENSLTMRVLARGIIYRQGIGCESEPVGHTDVLGKDHSKGAAPFILPATEY